MVRNENNVAMIKILLRDVIKVLLEIDHLQHVPLRGFFYWFVGWVLIGRSVSINLFCGSLGFFLRFRNDGQKILRKYTNTSSFNSEYKSLDTKLDRSD